MSDVDPGPGWHRNAGFCPEIAKGKRVRVILAHGSEPKYANETRSDVAPGWAADGSAGARWTKTGSPVDIEWYRVL